MLLEEEWLSVKHIIRHAIEEWSLAGAHVTNDAHKFTLFDLKVNLLEYQKILQGFISFVNLLIAQCDWLVKACETLSTLGALGVSNAPSSLIDSLLHCDHLPLWGAVMEGRTLSDCNSVIGSIACYFSHHGGINLFNHQEVLDAPHGYSKLNKLAYEKWQGSQGVLDHIENGNDCKGNVEA